MSGGPAGTASPVVGVMTAADAMTPSQLIDHARRLESAGHRSIWLPDVFGREIYVTSGFLLDHTESIGVTSGIAHMYGRDPVATVQAGRTLSELSGGRFAQGLGVSHPIAAEMRGDVWINPVDKARDYLTAMRGELPLHTPADPPPTPVYLAAHGPRLLQVAAELADGANTYLQPPSHARRAREVLGPDAALHVVLPCCLTRDAAVGRAAGRRAISIYLPLPAYQRQWRTHGFDESDWADGGSDRLVDASVAWGDLDAVVARMREHVDAGASGIVLAALPTDPADPASAWPLIEVVAPA